jgi:hypothetical protein
MEQNQRKDYVNTFDQRYEKRVGTPGDEASMDSRWYKEWLEYMYSYYVQDNGLIGYGGNLGRGRSIKTLRDYARGRQPVDKYIQILDPPDDQGRGFMNISWDTFKGLTKFREILLGKLESIDYSIRTFAVDEESNQERDELIAMMKAKINPHIMQLQETMGIQPEVSSGIDNEEDIDLLAELGGVRLGIEIEVKNAIDSVNQDDNINVVYGMIKQDLVDLNAFAVMPYMEHSSKTIRLKYIDPAKLVSRNSIYPDCRDIDFAGFVETKTIAQLRQESGLDENEIVKIAKMNSGVNGNPQFNGVGFREEYHSSTFYDEMTVDVFTGYWVAKETDRFITGINHKYGNKVFDRVRPDSKLNATDRKKGKEIVDISVHNIYTGKLVIGANIVYDCKKHEGVFREGGKGERRAVLPIVIWKGDSPSFVEKCVGLVDDIQLAIYKIRHLFVKLPPSPRLGIDLSLVRDSVKIGSQSYTIKDMDNAFYKTGTYYYESRGEFELQNGANRPPIMPIPIDVVEDYRLFNEEIANKIDQIRHTTGINEITDASSSGAHVLKGVMTGLQSATNNALRYYYTTIGDAYVRVSKQIKNLWQIMVLDGDIKKTFIANRTIKYLSLSKKVAFHEFRIGIEQIPSDEEKELMVNKLFQDNAQGVINTSDFFVLYNMIKSNDFKQAQLFYSKAVRKQERAMMEQQQAQMQAQAQANIQASRAMAEDKAAIDANKQSGKQQLVETTGAFKSQEGDKKRGHDKEMLFLEEMLKSNKDGSD